MRRALGSAAYLLVGVPLGVLWFAALATGLTLGVALAPVVVGVFVLGATWDAARLGTEVEARLARGLLGASSAPAAPVVTVRAKVLDAASWRTPAFLLVRTVTAWMLGLAMVCVLASGFGLVAAPLWYWALPEGIELGLFDVDTLAEAVAVVPAGVVLTALGVALAFGVSRLLRRTAEWGMPGGARTVAPIDWRVPLAWTITGAVFVGAIVASVWVLTGAGGTWVLWPLVSLALAVGLVASGVVGDRLPAGRPSRLGVLSTACGAVVAACVAFWALGGGGYPWPAWVALGGALMVALGALPRPAGVASGAVGSAA